VTIPEILRELAADIEAGKTREDVLVELERRMNRPERAREGELRGQT
jgi:hypothetical protein